MTPDPDRPAASTRAMEIAVAALLLLAGAVVIYDSLRVGIRWVSDGPQAGYFPFYIGVLLCLSAVWSLGQGLLEREASKRPFVSVSALKMIMAMLVPTIVYVALLAWLGLYVASFLYIGFFMIWLGKYSWLRAVAVAASVSVISFVLFEVWFTVPLPKGPLEAWLGLN
jgi:putative tricarboxylic transport membrane protein